MNPFNNPQIEIEGLPEAESLNFQSLEPSYKKVLLIINIIFWGIVIAVISIGMFTNQEDMPSLALIIVPTILFILILFSFLSIIFGFKNKLFAVRHQDLNYKKGWLWKSRMVVPFKRIQHSEVTQGPIDRIFKLAKLRVFTAGGSGSDLTIPGLKLEEANKLKTLITSRITEKAAADILVENQLTENHIIDKPNMDGREEE